MKQSIRRFSCLTITFCALVAFVRVDGAFADPSSNFVVGAALRAGIDSADLCTSQFSDGVGCTPYNPLVGFDLGARARLDDQLDMGLLLGFSTIPKAENQVIRLSADLRVQIPSVIPTWVGLEAGGALARDLYYASSTVRTVKNGYGGIIGVGGGLRIFAIGAFSMGVEAKIFMLIFPDDPTVG
ncbi:MAG: hypothetical protein SGI86_09885 [Deltaproteobacteria bacterium]|nr:hypothetical protein [Deltaproteobacteria bacterium]